MWLHSLNQVKGDLDHVLRQYLKKHPTQVYDRVPQSQGRVYQNKDPRSQDEGFDFD